MEDIFDLYKRWFSENGIIYNIDEDGDLHFRYQMCNFYIINPHDDKQFLQVMLPNIWSIEDEKERTDALQVANMLNMKRKALKVFITSTNTVLTVEMFIDNTPDVEDFMERVLDLLIQGRTLFAQEMRNRRQ